ncbi:hypothetical protein D1BOALGB6SA_3977 [Olavius sp. associated proteobacterium Delta 1]|nr:hypothetical protein D1BOALGB6SA_3977 [Olavius sp. associated proteobacterium Delta 1]
MVLLFMQEVYTLYAYLSFYFMIECLGLGPNNLKSQIFPQFNAILTGGSNFPMDLSFWQTSPI